MRNQTVLPHSGCVHVRVRALRDVGESTLYGRSRTGKKRLCHEAVDWRQMTVHQPRSPAALQTSLHRWKRSRDAHFHLM